MRKIPLGRVVAVLVVSVMGGCASMGRVDAERVGKLLGDRYPYSREIEGEDLQYVEDTRVEALALPALAKALPEVRFYRSNLRTASVDWPDVDILVAASESGLVAVCPSTWYGPTDEQFVGVLKQAKAVTLEDQMEVGGEIARMFATVTFPSEVRGSRMSDNLFSAEIWWGRTFWRRVMVGFAEGRVASVMLVNPRVGTTQSGG